MSISGYGAFLFGLVRLLGWSKENQGKQGKHGEIIPDREVSGRSPGFLEFFWRICGGQAVQLKLLTFRTTPLVTKGRAFYNPSKTALETEVVWFVRHPALNRLKERFCIPQASV